MSLSMQFSVQASIERLRGYSSAIAKINQSQKTVFSKEHRYLKLIQDVLPETKEIKEIFGFVYAFQQEHVFTRVPSNAAGRPAHGI